MALKSPDEVAAGMAQLGFRKAALPAGKTLLLGFLAGAYVALGGLLAVRAAGALPKEAWGGLARLVFGGVFPVGLMIVIVAGAELVTGNFMTQSLAYLDGKVGLFEGVVRNWVLVYLGNFAGSVFVAFVLAYLSGIVMEPVRTGDLVTQMPWAAFAVGTANAKTALSWWQAFLRAAGCNWLVGLAVWMAFSAEDIAGRILVIWWPIMAFAVIGFEHSVANMFLIPLGLFAGSDPAYLAFVGTSAGAAGHVPVLQATWGTFIVNNLIPVTLGNMAGAGVFVGAAYWYVYLRRAERGEAAKVSRAV
ncbi:MAG: formate/nitrite transporter family protein [Bacillota bacterium]|jgi:formate/nitrite transporter|nr:formate/nitrite transporter family protein [Bacillota bacterium]